MIRTDGTFSIYIIKHLYMSKKSNGWSCSGDCGQWLGHMMKKQPTLDERHKLHDSYRPLFNKFNACGDCWQETGISGTYSRSDAIDMCDLISLWFPEHKFKVCRVDITQKTIDVVEFK